MQPTLWTPELVNLVVAWQREGLSASHISRKLADSRGLHFTRNSVIGKLYRERDPSQPRRPRPPRTPREPKPRLAKRRRLPPQPQPPPIDAPMWLGVSLMELRNNNCRFPWHEDKPEQVEFTFCGDPTADLNGNRPYCPYHAQFTHRGFPR